MSRVSRGQLARPFLLLPVAFLMVLAAGCASQEFLGENPAKVVVRIHAQAEPVPIPETAHSRSPVTWYWGFYLVEEKGKLRKLREANGKRTTVLEENPLEAEGEFMVPAGQHKARLLVEAYQYYSIGRLPAPQSLIFFQRDYRLDLGPGQTGRIEALVGGAQSK